MSIPLSMSMSTSTATWEPAIEKDGWADFYRRCGNMASILEVSPGGKRFFNVFDAAPENESDGPAQQSQIKVSLVLRAS